MPKLLAIIGFLVICAGLDLLWRSRKEVRFWVLAYLTVFRARIRREDSPLIEYLSDEAADKRKHALPVALGLGFAFFLGPILIALSLTLSLYHNS